MCRLRGCLVSLSRSRGARRGGLAVCAKADCWCRGTSWCPASCLSTGSTDCREWSMRQSHLNVEKASCWWVQVRVRQLYCVLSRDCVLCKGAWHVITIDLPLDLQNKSHPPRRTLDTTRHATPLLSLCPSLLPTCSPPLPPTSALPRGSANPHRDASASPSTSESPPRSTAAPTRSLSDTHNISPLAARRASFLSVQLPWRAIDTPPCSRLGLSPSGG